MARTRSHQLRGPIAASTLVGRGPELDALLCAIGASPSVVLIDGEAGIGKTRLVSELLGRTPLNGLTTLLGGCQPMREPFPYGPVIDILRQTAPKLAGLTAQLSPVTGALGPLLPELSPFLPPAPAPVSPKAERHQVFRAVWQLLAAYSPAILVIEDLHWADEGTFELIRFLTCPPPPRLTVIMTCRISEPMVRARLLPVVGYRPPAEVTALHLKLEPLDQTQVSQLAADLIGATTIPGEFGAELHRRTAGIPFLVEEIMISLSELSDHSPSDATSLRPSTLDQVGVPALVRTIMDDRLARLGATTKTTARAAAVLGLPAADHEIAEVACLPRQRIATTLVRALEAGVLCESHSGRYALRHPLAYQAAYASIPAPNLRQLHARAGQVLSRRANPPAVQIAHHFRKAGQVVEWIRYTRLAVDQAADLGDYDTAISLLDQALSDTELPVEARNSLGIRLSQVALSAIANTELPERLQALLASGRLSQSARGEIRLNLGWLLINQVGALEAGQSEIETAIRDLHRRPALAARGMAALALPNFGSMPVGVHRHWMEEAERTVAGSTDLGLIAAVRANRLSLLMQTAEPSVWAAVAELGSPPNPPAEVRYQLARTYFNLADAAAWIGHYEAATKYLAVGARFTCPTDGQFLSALAVGTRVRLAVATGEWMLVSAQANELIESLRDMVSLAADAQIALAWHALGQGDLLRAAKMFDTAMATDAPAIAPILASACAGKVTVLLARGMEAAAASEADCGIGRLRRKDNWVWGAELIPVAVQALIRCGRIDESTTLTGEFRAGIEGRDAPLASAAAEVCDATLSRARGDLADAVRRFDDATDRYASLPQPYNAALALESAGLCLAEAGERDGAVARLQAAGAKFTKLGAVRDAKRCLQSLRLHQLAHGRRGRKPYGDTLSPREREVASLAGSGLTNREIAKALFLSPRTVEQHVATVLRKLGLSSRDSLASVA